MIQQAARKYLQKTLAQKQLAAFGGGDIRHKFTNEITDEEYKQFDKFMVTPPPKQENMFSLYNFFSVIPAFRGRTWQDFFSDSFQTSKVQQRSDFYRPPRVHENSVFVYQSKDLANTARKARSAELIVFSSGLFTLTNPLFFVAFFAPAYALWANSYFYEMSRRLVTRLDLLPHLEMVSVQRVGAGGIVYNKLYRTQDLEFVKFEDIEKQENYLWALNKHIIDKNLIFRCKVTGEYLFFDQQGQWDHEGLNHPLLN